MNVADFLLARIAEDLAGVDGFWDSGETDTEFQWGPARIRVECEAKRQIVDQWKEPAFGEDYGDGLANAWDDAVHILAAVYANHPDYRQEWAL